jgi:hypothetical protein
MSALSGFADLAAAEISSETKILAQKITQIRNNPVEYAQKLGLDPLLIENKFYWTSKNLENQTDFNITVINPSEQIQEKAFYINNQIAEKISFPEYDNSSLNGFLSFAITFNNYMEPETAVSIFVDDIFKREISPDYCGKRFIMNLNYNLTGIDIKEGKVESLNAYFITICFASSASVHEAYILNLINSVRNNSFLAYNYIFKNLIFADIFSYQLRALEAQSLRPVFSAPFSKNLETYDPLIKKDSIQTFEYYDPEFKNGFIEKAFSAFLLKELRDKKDNPFIFSHFLNSGSFLITSLGSQDKKSIAIYSLEGTFIENQCSNETVSKSYMVFYKDLNNDSLYNPGEGLLEARVFIEDISSGAKLDYETDFSGRIQVFLPGNNAYKLSFEYMGEYFEKIIKTDSGNIYSEIKL